MIDFITHPENVCMTYKTHFIFSISLSYKFALASIKALIHAFIPSFYINSSTNAVNDINKIIKNSGCTTR